MALHRQFQPVNVNGGFLFDDLLAYTGANPQFTSADSITPATSGTTGTLTAPSFTGTTAVGLDNGATDSTYIGYTHGVWYGRTGKTTASGTPATDKYYTGPHGSLLRGSPSINLNALSLFELSFRLGDISATPTDGTTGEDWYVIAGIGSDAGDSGGLFGSHSLIMKTGGTSSSTAAGNTKVYASLRLSSAEVSGTSSANGMGLNGGPSMETWMIQWLSPSIGSSVVNFYRNGNLITSMTGVGINSASGTNWIGTKNLGVGVGIVRRTGNGVYSSAFTTDRTFKLDYISMKWRIRNSSVRV